MSKARNLDIFALIKATDHRKLNWLAAQSDEARAEFAPLVALRWATGLKEGDEAACLLWVINRRVNVHLFDLAQDKDLSYRLLASCGLGSPLRREWLAAPLHRNSSNLAYRLLLTQHPTANDAELRLLLGSYTRAQFADFVRDNGKSKSETKPYLDAFDKATAE